MNRELLEAWARDKELFLHFLLVHLIGKRGVNLSLSVTDRCRSGCLHCLTNACPNGKSLPLEVLEKIDGRYFQSDEIGLYCEGEPLDYEWESVDFADVAEIFVRRGVTNINFLTSGMLSADQERYKVWRRLQGLEKKSDISFHPELSFHLYWPVALGTDAADVAKERLRYSLPLCLELSSEIFVHLRGDLISSAANFIAVLSAYLEVLKELGFNQTPCENCLHPCQGATICREKDAAVLRADFQITQPFGRWQKNLEHCGVSLLNSKEQEDLSRAVGLRDQDFSLMPGQRRWIDSNSLTSLYARTNGDVDISYSVAALGMPRRIANIFEQSYEEVVISWGNYLWEHFVGEAEILEQGGNFIFFEK